MALTTQTKEGTALLVEMPYIPSLTDNHRTGQNGFRKFLKREVKEWQDDLAMLVRNQMALADLRFKDDQRFVIRISFTLPKRSRGDCANYHKSIGDAIKAGLGVDDKFFTFEDDRDIELVDNARDAFFYIKIIPLEQA